MSRRRQETERTVHIRVLGWNEHEDYWDVIGETLSGERSAMADCWGIRDLDDGVDAAWSRNCDLLISEGVYDEMLERGDARLPRHPRARF